MRLHSISLENFKSFRDEAVIPLSQTTCLIGPNGAGKSNILHGLKALSSIIAGNGYAPEPGDYFNNDTDREMKLAVVMELSNDERKAMVARMDAPSAALLRSDLVEWLFRRLKYEASFGDDSQTHAVSLTFTDADYHVFASVTQDHEKYTAQRLDVDMIDAIGGVLPGLEPFNLTSTKIDFLLRNIDKSLIPIITDMFSGISDIGVNRSIPQSSSPRESHGITPDGSNILNEVNSLPLDKKIEFNKFLDSITGGSISGIEASMKDSELVLEAAEPGLDRRTPRADFSSGQEQLILLALQLFVRPGTAFVLTEPELHLHARAQKQVQGRVGDASSKLQIIIETHSPIFLGSDPGESVLLITKAEGSSHVTPIGQGNLDLIRDELGVTHRDSLHHENVLFVEGDSEHAAFPRFMSTLGHSVVSKTAVFNLGGVGRIRHLPLLLRYFRDDGQKVFVILDDNKAAHSYTKKLVDAGLLDKNFFILEKNFEDAFASTTIMDAVKEMAMQHGCEFSLTADNLDAERGTGRRVDAVLQERWRKETGRDFNKVDLAKLLADLPSDSIPSEIKSALQAAADHFVQGDDGDPAKGGDAGGRESGVIRNADNYRTGQPGPVQDGGNGPDPEAGPSHSPSAPARLDWDDYCRQEDREPFDVVRETKGAVRRGDLDPDHRLELQVQELVRRIKMRSQDYKSRQEELFECVKCEIPPEAVAHCKSRLGRSGGISTLLTWHYYLLLYFAEKGDWLRRALDLMLESAAKTSDDCRASSYIMSAHNLNKWFNCREDEAVLNSALRFVEKRDHNDFTHWCVHIVADLERDPAVLDGMRDAMIRAADGLGHLHAAHCLEAAVRVAADKGPAREACMRLYEGHADGLGRPPIMMHEYIVAHRYADSAEDRTRLADKVIRAAGSVEFTEYPHTFEAPAFDLPGDTGPERVRYLVGLLDGLIAAAGTADPPCDREERDHHDHFYRTSIGSDGLPGPSRLGPRAEEAAARGDRLARYTQILAAFLSATALPYESDGRIAPRDHMDVIRSTGLSGGPTEALIEAGIERHHAGDYASSVHTLLPQVEQVLRLVLDKSGIPVVGADGATEFGLLKALIRRGSGVLGPDLSAFLSALLVDTDSVNLRNRVCHGLHSQSACPEGSSLPHDFGHAASLLLVLVIELVCGHPGRVTSPGGGGRG